MIRKAAIPQSSSETIIKMKTFVSILFAGALGVAPVIADQHQPPATHDPSGSLTAEDQGNTPLDRELTSRIRASLMEKDDLSVAGRNVKIITRDGKVTLRGHVPTPSEREAIFTTAQAIAGMANVTNHLEVQP